MKNPKPDPKINPQGTENFSCPENLIEDLLRSRSLSRGLESLGYPDFLVRLYKKALHSRRIMA